MSRSQWKAPFVNSQIIKLISKSKDRQIVRTNSRSSTILKSFIGLIFEIHTGKQYTKIYIDEKMVGHKLGEFAFTRKLGRIHEKKTNKRKSTKK